MVRKHYVIVQCIKIYDIVQNAARKNINTMFTSCSVSGRKEKQRIITIWKSVRRQDDADCNQNQSYIVHQCIKHQINIAIASIDVGNVIFVHNFSNIYTIGWIFSYTISTAIAIDFHYHSIEMMCNNRMHWR